MKYTHFHYTTNENMKTCGNAVPTRSRSTSPLALPLWDFQNDLSSGAKSGVLPPDLRFSMPFWVFLLKIWGFQI